MSVFSQIIAFVPAVLVIVLALITKKTHFSLSHRIPGLHHPAPDL